MLMQWLVFALTLISSSVPIALQADSSTARPGEPQGRSRWLRSESRRFEIHYQPGLARELDRVVRSAEAAYDRVGNRLSFALATKVPLIVFAASGPMTREEVAAFASSDQVTPPQPHQPRPDGDRDPSKHKQDADRGASILQSRLARQPGRTVGC